MKKGTGIKHWLYQKLIGAVFESRDKAEKGLRECARERAYTSPSGMGGIVEVNFLTPRPWRYESSFWRKIAWVIYLSFFDRKMSTVILPLSLDEYLKKRKIIFGSGTRIERCGNGEVVTLSHAFFDPYAGRD